MKNCVGGNSHYTFSTNFYLYIENSCLRHTYLYRGMNTLKKSTHDQKTEMQETQKPKINIIKVFEIRFIWWILE